MKIISSLTFILLAFRLISCSGDRPDIALEELTISEIHQAYEQGDYTAVQLVSAYLDRIQGQDSSLNSITVINPWALDEAQALDEHFRQTGTLLPLHGIPVIVKDNINTAGLLTTGGSRALAGFRPEQDAFIIQKLRQAGAVVIAKSNMAELAFSPMHTESTTFGITHNPYDTSKVPAGSSGGTAAAIAANFGVIGLGTDTGNSIRGPSSHCSLVGFRTTLGLVSRSGVIPLYLRNDVAGPMCRTVEDATLTLQAIAGFDPQDVLTRYGQQYEGINYIAHLRPDGLRGKRIGVLQDLAYDDIDPDIEALFASAITDMKAAGAVITDPVTVPGFASLHAGQWCPVFREDIESYLQTYVKNDTIATLEDIIRIGTASEYARQSLEYFVEHNPDRPCGDPYTDIRRIAFREAIEAVMDSLQLDALVYPSWNFPPADIHEFREGYKGDNSQVISPHTGQPAFTVPMGFNSDGLPAGLQILGRMYSEPLLIEIAYGYEQNTHHRRPPEAFSGMKY